jgi:AhpD family alkylhydroperoxidase
VGADRAIGRRIAAVLRQIKVPQAAIDYGPRELMPSSQLGPVMRIAPRDVKKCPWYLQPFFWNQRRKYGKALDASLLWARSPKLFLGVAVLYGMIDRRSSPIDPALRSLVTVRVSQINWCTFCVDLNSATLLKRGANMEKVEALPNWRGSNLFDERERAALDYAEAVTRSDRGVEDRHIDALRRHFSDDAIIELTALISFQNLSSKFNAALAVAPQGFCRLPERPVA